jgi:deoxyribodipyrimidine photo-lyase
MATVFWFRRDLRLQDNEALAAAARAAADTASRELILVYPLELQGVPTIRQQALVASLKALNESLDGQLTVAAGAPERVLAELAAQGHGPVYATEAFDPSGILQQRAVAQQLATAGTELRLLGSYYAVPPGTVRKDDGSQVRVYTPFYKRWLVAGWPPPIAVSLDGLSVTGLGQQWPEWSNSFKMVAGEAFALRTWQRFRERALSSYSDNRNRADLSGTSQLSHALAHGEIHPRTLLVQLGDQPGHETYRKELAWREFYADVLWHHPHTVDDYYEPRFRAMRYDVGELAEERFAAWSQGKTGYPMVDAAMRQLLETGWMHNRSRMIVASFLVKDLHLEWQRGARWFEEHLTDFDPASNSHGWQWTAGCGTDASPYYRVFNPILQGLKFDPQGDYVRRFVPELRHLEGAQVHEPWLLIDGLAHGYPGPIVDHATERDESLRRLEEIKPAGQPAS